MTKEGKKVYTITCFTEITPEKLGNYLKGISFKHTKDGFEWSIDGYTFRIVPFKNQPRDSLKGYRVYFDGDMNGGTYLFNLSMGCLSPIVTGVEFVLEHEDMKTMDWIKELRKHPSFKRTDMYGIYEKNGMGLIVVNDSITIQMRSKKNKKLILIDCMRQIESIRDELKPVDFNLFSILQEDIV